MRLLHQLTVVILIEYCIFTHCNKTLDFDFVNDSMKTPFLITQMLTSHTNITNVIWLLLKSLSNQMYCVFFNIKLLNFNVYIGGLNVLNKCMFIKLFDWKFVSSVTIRLLSLLWWPLFGSYMNRSNTAMGQYHFTRVLH